MRLPMFLCLTLVSGACAHLPPTKGEEKSAADALTEAFLEVGPKPYPAWKSPEDFCVSLRRPTNAEGTAYLASTKAWEEAVCDRFNTLADDGWRCRQLTKDEVESGSTCWPDPYPRCGDRTDLVLNRDGLRYEARIFPETAKEAVSKVQIAPWPARCEGQ